MQNKYSLKSREDSKNQAEKTKLSIPSNETIQKILQFSKSYEVLKPGNELLSVNLN